jgi:hypothetical protein
LIGRGSSHGGLSTLLACRNRLWAQRA